MSSFPPLSRNRLRCTSSNLSRPIGQVRYDRASRISGGFRTLCPDPLGNIFRLGELTDRLTVASVGAALTRIDFSQPKRFIDSRCGWAALSSMGTASKPSANVSRGCREFVTKS